MAKKTQTPYYLRQAVKYVEYWVPRLRLENYEIEVVTAPDDADYYGEVHGDVCNLRAQIRIRDPKKAELDSLACKDLEVTVTHELVHVRFGEVCLELEGKAATGNEVATEMLAMALVAARRGVHPRSLYSSTKI